MTLATIWLLAKSKESLTRAIQSKSPGQAWWAIQDLPREVNQGNRLRITETAMQKEIQDQSARKAKSHPIQKGMDYIKRSGLTRKAKLATV